MHPNIHADGIELHEAEQFGEIILYGWYVFVDLWSISNQCFVLVHTVLKIATSMKRCLIHESKFLKQLEMRG